jgi:hypothetical protein
VLCNEIGVEWRGKKRTNTMQNLLTQTSKHARANTHTRGVGEDIYIYILKYFARSNIIYTHWKKSTYDRSLYKVVAIEMNIQLLRNSFFLLRHLSESTRQRHSLLEQLNYVTSRKGTNEKLEACWK